MSGLKSKPRIFMNLYQQGDYSVVSPGKKYTGTSRQRRYFHSRREAYDFLARAEDARIRLGREAFVLPLNLRAEAFACWQPADFKSTPYFHRDLWTAHIEHFQRTDCRRTSGLDPDFFKYFLDVLFHCGFSDAQNRGNV